MIEILVKNHLESDNICNIVNPQRPFYKEWQIILSLYLVLVTLHGRFTMSIQFEQDK